MSAFDPSAPTRQIVYRLFTVVAFAAVCGRIANVETVYEPGIHFDPAPDLAGVVLPLAASTASDALTAGAVASTAWQRIDRNPPTRRWPRVRPLPVPTFGSNDRSRWATVRALVDEGTYAVGRRTYDADGKYRD